MQNQIEIQRSLERVAAALNDGGPDQFDTDRVQLIVDDAVGAKPRLTVDEGGAFTTCRAPAWRDPACPQRRVDHRRSERRCGPRRCRDPRAAHEQNEPAEDDEAQR